MLLRDLRHVPIVTREAHRHLVAQPKSRVVPAVELHRPDLQASPIRELLSNQTRHHVNGDVFLPHLAVLPSADSSVASDSHQGDARNDHSLVGYATTVVRGCRGSADVTAPHCRIVRRRVRHLSLVCRPWCDCPSNAGSVSFACDLCRQFGGVGDGDGDLGAEGCRDAVEGGQAGEIRPPSRRAMADWVVPTSSASCR